MHLIKRGKIILYLRNGDKFIIRVKENDCWPIEEVYARKLYTPTGFEVGKYDVVVDIGGYMGDFTVYAARKAMNGKVIAYEPLPENFRMLLCNVLLNNLTNTVCLNYAVAGSRGRRVLRYTPDHPSMASFYKPSSSFVTVHCITLADIFENNNLKTVNFLKMDCEGAEYEILFNTPEEYMKRIEKISLSYHDLSQIGALKKFLERGGFKITIKNHMLYALNQNLK